MEGSPDDIKASSEKKDDKKAKKTETAFGLGKSTFEFSNKKDKAEKIAEAPLWEKLIPKDGISKVEKPTAETSPETSVEAGIEEDNDPTVEQLTEAEKPKVVELIEDERAEAAEAALSSAEDPAEIAELTEVINHYEQRKEARADIPEAAPDEELGAAAEGEVEAGAGEQSEAEMAEQPAAPAEFEHDQEIPLNTAEDAPVQPVPPNTPAAVPPSTPNRPPATPAGPGGPNGPGNSRGGPNFNAMPAPGPGANPNTAPTTTRVEYVRDRRSEGAYFLAGGIIGYLLGRRRGRIKTEKRMNVVTQKLEKQIDQVRQEVVLQETVIREQARERYNLTHAQTQERTSVPRGAETTAARTVSPERRTEAVAKLTPAEVATNQRQAAERLGITPPEAAATAERIQRFDHREVLAIAEKIVIDGTSLRTIYESKQITEPGLRRITREFLRGGDIKAALQAEIQVKEMQYERDPQMRDRLAASYADVDAAQPRASSEAMAALVAHATEPARIPLKDNTEAAEAAAQATKERGKKALVSAWAVLVVVLVIVAVVLAAR